MKITGSVLFLLAILIPSVAVAATSDQTAAFLRNGSGARALALGKAMVAIADDADAVYWNPAGLVQLEERQLSYLFARPLGDISGLQYHTFAFAIPDNEQAFGIDLIYFDAGSFTGYDDQANRLGDYDANSYAFHLAYAKPWENNTSWGVGLKYVHQEIAGSSGNGYGADIGFRYAPKATKWSMGILLQDIVGANIKLANESSRMPLRVWLGGAWQPFPELTISVAGDKTSQSDFNAHFGLEYTPAEPLVLRGGYTGESEEFSAGIGFVSGKYTLDYAYSTHQDLGDSHRVGLRMMY